MQNIKQAPIIDTLREVAHPLTGKQTDYDPLLESIGEARFVLLGEASHGTSEFYHARAEITKRLITEKHFTAVAVEADWPDAYRVNRYVRGAADDATAREALASFQRFPIWMWRNQEVLAFLDWLKTSNNRRKARKVGFYGLDLYSLYRSIEAVIAYLEQIDPEAAQRARYRYSCFEHFGEDAEAYGYAAGFELSSSCEQEVINQLVELQQRTNASQRRDGLIAEDELFSAEQNARLVKNAEVYYRTMFSGRVSSWNLRDQHMAETLDALVAHLDQHYPEPTKVVLWAHNSHLGDARATAMGNTGELNVGQLVRERYQRDAFLVGFSTYSGTVTAASDWGAVHERKRVRPALAGSYEALFHETDIPDFLLPLREKDKAAQVLSEPRLERAIGVIYQPQSERISHYFTATLPAQFDLVLHFDETNAVEPLDRTEPWEQGEPEPPETYPTAL